MKRVLFISLFLIISNVLYAQSMFDGIFGSKNKSGDGGSSSQSTGNTTQVNVIDNDTGGESTGNHPPEARWNIDVVGPIYVFTDQPASRQGVTNVTEVGVTFKFDPLMHFWFKRVFFKVNGRDFDDGNTEWQHEHYLGGAGMRWYVGEGENTQIVFNVGGGKSKVTETESGDEIQDLETALCADFKLFWMSGDFRYGLIVSKLEVESKAKRQKDYKKGGYFSVGFNIQIPISY
jgi:hypothetical protein